MEKLQQQQGWLKDGIAFAHSGFTAPVLTAIETMKYDVESVIIYEGPHPNYQARFTNPSLRRIIHVMGSNHEVQDSLDEGDSPVPFLGWAKFTGADPDKFENINIEILGAFHSDYSYDPTQYEPGGEFENANADREQTHRRVNLFMRDLYRAVLDEQNQIGELNAFFQRQINRGAAKKIDGRWQIDPDKLRDV